MDSIIIVDHRHRTSSAPQINPNERDEKGRKIKRYSVDITYKTKGQPTPYYFSILYLSEKEYASATGHFPSGEVADYAMIIKTVLERTRAFADVLDPFLMPVFKNIITNIKKNESSILTDPELHFNIQDIASKYLEIYKNEHLGAEIPTLRQTKQAENNSMIPATLRTYTEQVQANRPPINYQTVAEALKPQIIPSGSGEGIVEAGIGDTGNPTQILIQNTYIINGGGGNGQFQLPSSTLNPDGNFLNWLIDSMNKANTKATDNRYKSIKRCMIRYYKKIEKLEGEEGKEHISFRTITHHDLMQMEAWMIREGSLSKNGKKKSMTPSTVRTYISGIKSAFELAEDQGIIPPNMNPFAKGKYRLLEAKQQDRSLTKEELKLTLKYIPEPPQKFARGRKNKDNTERRQFSMEMARDYWLFSYISGGTNFMDIAKLKECKIVGEKFGYIRSKTQKKVRSYEDTEVKITPEMQYLLEIYGCKSNDPNAYVFPIILKEPVPPKPIEEMSNDEEIRWRKEEHAEISRQVNNFTKQVNAYMRKIAEKLNFHPKKFTTYSARHTFANEALEFMTAKMVSMKMGQKSVTSLGNYTNRPDLEAEAKVNKKVTQHISFKKKIVKKAA